MLNTDYTNGTNVFEWRLRKIRGIRAIRVPSKIFRVIYVEHGLHEWHECVRMAFAKKS